MFNRTSVENIFAAVYRQSMTSLLSMLERAGRVTVQSRLSNLIRTKYSNFLLHATAPLRRRITTKFQNKDIQQYRTIHLGLLLKNTIQLVWMSSKKASQKRYKTVGLQTHSIQSKHPPKWVEQSQNPASLTYHPSE